MSIESSRRAAATAFVLLLFLSVVWPAPVVEVNRICCGANIAVDDLSFLGREAPSWDVVYWCIAGLFAIALLQRGADFSAIREAWRTIAFRPRAGLFLFAAASAATVAMVWLWLDASIMAWSERVESARIDDWIRYANRFGGGLNPVMVIGFFVLAGAAYRSREWVWYGVAMAFAGAAAGILVQVVKFAVGRTRPELWLGPFHHARAAASSFPSGHTVGAFALAGVLMLRAESKTLRMIAALLATAVGLSRVLAFRHWPSDVIASAAIGLMCAAAVARRPGAEVSSLRPAPQSSHSPDASTPPLPS